MGADSQRIWSGWGYSIVNQRFAYYLCNLLILCVLSGFFNFCLTFWGSLEKPFVVEAEVSGLTACFDAYDNVVEELYFQQFACIEDVLGEAPVGRAGT